MKTAIRIAMAVLVVATLTQVAIAGASGAATPTSTVVTCTTLRDTHRGALVLVFFGCKGRGREFTRASWNTTYGFPDQLVWNGGSVRPSTRPTDRATPRARRPTAAMPICGMSCGTPAPSPGRIATICSSPRGVARRNGTVLLPAP